MKKRKPNAEKREKDSIPDIKKIEKSIQTENQRKMIEVPGDVPEDAAHPDSPEEIPERKEENETPPPGKE